MGSTAFSDNFQRFRIPAYLFLCFTLLFQLIETGMGLIPFKPSSANWRFAVTGGNSLAVGNLLLIVLLLYVLVVTMSDWKYLPILGVLSGFAATVMLVASAGLILDTLQIRGSMPDDGTRVRLVMAAGGAFLRLTSQGVISAMFAVAAFGKWKLETRSSDRAGKRQESMGAENLIVSRPSKSS